MGEVFSRAAGYTSLATMIGPLLFHIVCMAVGGFFFKQGVQKAPVEPEKSTVNA
jgi:hypothetical protein